MRVLIADAQESTARALSIRLACEGMATETTDLGDDVVGMMKVYDFDVLVLDLDLPDMSGLKVVGQLRAAKISTPILMLAYDGKIETKTKALWSGADDYMTKPFHLDEVVARVHALARRAYGHAQSVINLGRLSVNLSSRTVMVSGQPVHLTGKEWAVLEVLAIRKGMTLTKEVIMNHVYGGRDEPEIKIVDVFICKIRRKLRLAGSDATPETVWGRGYALHDVAVPAVAA